MKVFSKKEDLLESITEVQVTEAHIMRHLCQACFQGAIGADEMSAAKFHKFRIAATAAITRQQDGITTITKDDYQTLARRVYNVRGRKPFAAACD